MSTLSEIIANVQNPPDRGTANRARSFTKRQLVSWINITRAFLITKDVEKGDSFPVAFQQDLGCWPLEQVDEADCPNGWEWGDDVKRAVFPDVMEIKDNAGIAFFGLIDKRTQIYWPSQIYGELDDALRYKGKNKWLSQMIGNNTIYIKGPTVPKLKVVNIRGIFKDPTLVSFYTALGEKYCYDPDKDQYPLPGDLEGVLYQMVWANYILPFVQAPRDNTNQEANKALM